MVFNKTNYLILIVSVITMALSLIIMSMEDAKHGFGPLALNVAPIMMCISIVIGFVAIFYKGKKES